MFVKLVAEKFLKNASLLNKNIVKIIEKHAGLT